MMLVCSQERRAERERDSKPEEAKGREDRSCMCINSAPAAAANRNSSSTGGKERKRQTRRESWREA